MKTSDVSRGTHSDLESCKKMASFFHGIGVRGTVVRKSFQEEKCAASIVACVLTLTLILFVALISLPK